MTLISAFAIAWPTVAQARSKSRRNTSNGSPLSVFSSAVLVVPAMRCARMETAASVASAARNSPRLFSNNSSAVSSVDFSGQLVRERTSLDSRMCTSAEPSRRPGSTFTNSFAARESSPAALRRDLRIESSPRSVSSNHWVSRRPASGSSATNVTRLFVRYCLTRGQTTAGASPTTSQCRSPSFCILTYWSSAMPTRPCGFGSIGSSTDPTLVFCGMSGTTNNGCTRWPSKSPGTRSGGAVPAKRYSLCRSLKNTSGPP